VSTPVTYVIPTRNRASVLHATLESIGSLPRHDAHVIVIDNASDEVPSVPTTLGNGIGVSLIELDENEGAAARNRGVEASETPWVVMLDDDSMPRDLGFLTALNEAPSDVGAVSADIYLPRVGTREQGGLPEVFIGCGVAVRREAFVGAGGYDAGFGFYAEEYDLSAKLMLDGLSVRFDDRFVVDHLKTFEGRDLELIVERLVRNNGWVMQRYAPEDERRERIREIRDRYRAIAQHESATAGYARGLTELRATIREQRRRPMTRELFDRFTGLAHATEALGTACDALRFRTAQVVDPGKNAWAVRRALETLGVREVASGGDVRVIGTMSPGPMLDALERERESGGPVIAPWKGVWKGHRERRAA